MNRHKTVKQAILTVVTMAPLLLLTGCLTAGPDGQYDIIGFLTQPFVLVIIGAVVLLWWLKGRKK